MKKKRYTPEQIIEKLREAEVWLSKGESVGKMSRNIGVSEQTYYRWRNEYGGMRIDQAKRLKEIEKENSRLRKLVADLSLDNAILKEANGIKYFRGQSSHVQNLQKVWRYLASSSSTQESGIVCTTIFWVD